MTQQINITVGEGDTSEVVTLNGIPADMWTRFKEHAALQFPSSGELGWAQYLSEVIAAAGGGDEMLSYFMTKVPVKYGQALADHLSQVSLTWPEFHALLLRTAVMDHQLRLSTFRDSGHTGVFIMMGINPEWFTKVEEAAGKGFEAVMATILFSAGNGSLVFGPDSKFLEPAKDG
jgi:hypothetical protein